MPTPDPTPSGAGTVDAKHEPSKTVSAIRKLELSRVNPKAIQREAMGEDVDVEKFALYLSSKVKVNIVDRITQADISRSIEAATTLTVTITDYDRALLTSGLLSSKLDVELDGLWFRLSGVDKSGDELTLTFEDREIAVLRNYSKWKVARRSKVTRAEFVLNLIREVKEFHIPVVIPELHTTQPIERFAGDTIGEDAAISMQRGISTAPGGDNLWSIGSPFGSNIFNPNPSAAEKRSQLKVHGGPADNDQITNANHIMAVGMQMMSNDNLQKRKIILSAVMCAIRESTLHNVDYGDLAGPDSRGLFQQRATGWGSLEDRMNPESAARMYYNHAIPLAKKYPDITIIGLITMVQFPGLTRPQAEEYPSPYAQFQDYAWQNEGEALLNAFGIVGGDNEATAASANGSGANVKQTGIADSGDPSLTDMPTSLSQLPGGTSADGGEFFFYRGTLEDHGKRKVRKPENSWTCILDLANDVQYRAFFISGTFYWISEDDLFKQKPEYTLTEFMDGITSIDGEYHMGKGNGSVTINARVGRWMAPPGKIVVFENMGPWNGRWLVSDYSRSLFNLDAEITLKKPMPILPEPLQGNEKEIQKTWLPKPVPPASGNQPPAPAIETPGTRQGLAKQLLLANTAGRFVDDRGAQDDLSQIQKVSRGEKLAGPCGNAVDLDIRVMEILLWLISLGYKIGVFALCENHDCHTDSGGISRHSAGAAVDISSINGHNIGSDSSAKCKELVLAVASALNDDSGDLLPVQIITGGYGSHRDSQCESLCRPANFYDNGTLNGHTNHIHVGY